MRKLIALLLTLGIVLSPVASGFAMALGGSGEHVHFDHVWHAVDRHDAQHHHDDADHHHDQAQNAGNGQDDLGGPLKHTHIDVVHTAVFLVVPAATLFCPPVVRDLAVAKVSFPAHLTPYPPFRPPQTA